jgi:hypothetical protein
MEFQIVEYFTFLLFVETDTTVRVMLAEEKMYMRYLANAQAFHGETIPPQIRRL